MNSFRWSRACGLPALFVLAGCAKQAPQVAPPPPLVHIMQPVVRNVIEWDEYIGRLEAVESVEIRPRVSGYLDRIHFREGRQVNKGDLLFTIDPRPYQAELDGAEAELQRAVSQTELAKNDLTRAERLIATKAISEEDFDSKAKTFAVTQAAVRSAQAAVDAARLNLEFTRIRAPITGRIGRALITEGNLVAGGTVGSSVLATLVSLDPIYCYVDIDERSILKYIQLNRDGVHSSPRYAAVPVEMALINDTGFPHKGYADFVENRVDPGTGTLKARGVFPNPDHGLSPGFFARLRTQGSGEYAAMLIPDRALGSDQAQKFVFVVGAGDTVEYRPVTIGPMIDGLRVVATGLKAEDRVIVEGLMRVRPGIVVTPKDAPATSGTLVASSEGTP